MEKSLTIPILLANIGNMNPNFQYKNRDLENLIERNLDKNKVIIIYGARQVGKTTLVKKFFEKRQLSYLYLSCEESPIREQLKPDSLILKQIISGYKNIVFDEAQYIDNPGLILKILIDNFPHLNIIATGSSVFDLGNKINEPLTGRHIKFLLFPFEISEIYKFTSPLNFDYFLKESLVFGSYPNLYQLQNKEEKINYLIHLSDNYLYKDILSYNLVKNSRKLKELLIALALQLGSEVSYNELSSLLSIDKKTVENFIDLLEKSFVLFRLYGFSRNLRSEINRKVKIYFYDLGIRNSLINNFNSLDLRNDAGALFENYFIAEKLKINSNLPHKFNYYFWRTYEQKEIDLIEEKNNYLTAYEVKTKKAKRNSAFVSFSKTYPNSQFKKITFDNFIEELI